MVPPLLEELRSRGHHVQAVGADHGQVAAATAPADVAIVQYDDDVDGEIDGAHVLSVLQSLQMPSVVVLHNVYARPTQRQRALLTAVVGAADCTIVMSSGARQNLIDAYSVDPSRVAMIPHGGSIPDPHARQSAEHDHRSPQLLTWGPLGPGRGIAEHVIDALALLGDLRPRPQYTIAGHAQPNAFARNGDQHRNSLIRRAWAAGVVGSVTFDDAHRGPGELDRFIASAKVAVLPYESRDHITSPVLVGAITAGLPVVASAFPHAVELLSGTAQLDHGRRSVPRRHRTTGRGPRGVHVSSASRHVVARHFRSALPSAIACTVNDPTTASIHPSFDGHRFEP